jgi:hypothetical protein
MREGNRKYKQNEREERSENKKQLLGFDDVNFEQKREPYSGRTRVNSNNPQQNSNRQPESRNRR